MQTIVAFIRKGYIHYSDEVQHYDVYDVYKVQHQLLFFSLGI